MHGPVCEGPVPLDTSSRHRRSNMCAMPVAPAPLPALWTEPGCASMGERFSKTFLRPVFFCNASIAVMDVAIRSTLLRTTPGRAPLVRPFTVTRPRTHAAASRPSSRLKAHPEGNKSWYGVSTWLRPHTADICSAPSSGGWTRDGGQPGHAWLAAHGSGCGPQRRPRDTQGPARGAWDGCEWASPGNLVVHGPPLVPGRWSTPAVWLLCCSGTQLALPAAGAAAEVGKLFDIDATLPIVMLQVLLLTFLLDKMLFGPVGRHLDARKALLDSKRADVKRLAARTEEFKVQAFHRCKTWGVPGCLIWVGGWRPGWQGRRGTWLGGCEREGRASVQPLLFGRTRAQPAQGTLALLLQKEADEIMARVEKEIQEKVDVAVKEIKQEHEAAFEASKKVRAGRVAV